MKKDIYLIKSSVIKHDTFFFSEIQYYRYYTCERLWFPSINTNLHEIMKYLSTVVDTYCIIFKNEEILNFWSRIASYIIQFMQLSKWSAILPSCDANLFQRQSTIYIWTKIDEQPLEGASCLEVRELEISLIFLFVHVIGYFCRTESNRFNLTLNREPSYVHP